MLIISKGGFQFMKKFKLVKTAAALALGASVVTAAVVPGATDASAASKYKVSNGKLLNAKTGKAVKGYVVYKSKLYYNGKVKKGYKTVGTGKSIKLYYNGTLKKGYKTARDNKLLFFNGKLKKGYKTALSGEYLYKDGFLNKGYKVYGDVDKSPVLYYNGKLKSGYKTANNGTLLFYNGKLKAGYKTAKGGTVLYKEGRLTKGLVEFDGKFYNDSKLANGEVDGTFYKDGKAVVALEGVKAINNTTVEVTFKNAQVKEDIKASRFAIEGLEVKNAAVKQTNSKVVVLTTAAQEAGKTYTLSVDGVQAKTFTAVSSVAPTAVELSTPSIQGVLGKEVTVTSKVTVPDGQSKAGIPVTFNVAANGTFNEDKVIEALTDENGVAKISYTQYHAGEDTVYAYPTGVANVKSTVGKVYWGNAERLTVIDVTAGTKLANGSKKVYKVTSPENAKGYVNVTFKENVNVDANKLVRDVEITDVDSDNKYPYQVTTGGVKYAKVKLDSKGEGTFTLTGSNATVTPIVFADGSNDDYKLAAKNNKIEATELQAEASSVTFEKQSTVGVSVKAIGESRAAAKTTKGDGGRDYTVTVTDKDGKLAPAGKKAYVTFTEENLSKDKNVYIDGVKVTAGNSYAVTVEKDGQVTFKLTGDLDAYATPTVYLDNGKTVGSFDKDDESAVSEQVYFVNAIVEDATLEPNKAKVEVGTQSTFTYQSVDQNGFPYYADNGVYDVTFEVQAHFGDITVNGTKVLAGKVGSFTVKSNNGKATINVVSTLPGTVTVNASTSQKSLPNKDAKVEFVNPSDANTIVVPDSIVDAVKKASNVTEVKAALKGFDTYETLSDAGKDAVASKIYLSVDKSAAFIGKAIADEKLKEQTADALVKATDFETKHATALSYAASTVTAVTAKTDTAYVNAKAFVTAYEGLTADVIAKLTATTTPKYNELKAALAVADANIAASEAANAAAVQAALVAINGGSATAAQYTTAGITGNLSVAADLSGANAAVTTAKTKKGSDLTKAEIQELVSVVVINAGSATVADYKALGITGVSSLNIGTVNTGIATAKTTKGSDLTKVEIQKVVNGEL